MDVNCFSDLDAFKADMDHLMDEASRMKPLPSFDESFPARRQGARAGNRVPQRWRADFSTSG